MAIPHVVVLAAALLALLFLPGAVAVVLCADEVALRRSWSRRDPRQMMLLRRLDREMTAIRRPPVDGTTVPSREQIAAELRRLDRQRRSGPTTQSQVWLDAVLRAYDEWLRVACRQLGIEEHLQPLDGMDREIERLRVQAELQANGMTFR